MMMPTEATQVALLRRTIPISDHMIQITDRDTTSGESALPISGFDELGKRFRGSVARFADAFEVSDLIGEDFPPGSLSGKLPSRRSGDMAITFEVTGVV